MLRLQYNVQFYNQGLYGDCTGLLTKSGGAFPGSSLFEIPKHGIPLNKLVIGKPATAADGTNGYMSPGTLGQCVKKAKAKGWNGGVMVWQVRRSPLLSPLVWWLTPPSAYTYSTPTPTLAGSSPRRAARSGKRLSEVWRLRVARPRTPIPPSAIPVDRAARTSRLFTIMRETNLSIPPYRTTYNVLRS